MKNLNGSCAEIIGVAAYEQCEKFVETLDKYQQFTDIRNVGAAVHSMIDAANEKMDDAGFDPDMDWTYLAKYLAVLPFRRIGRSNQKKL